MDVCHCLQLASFFELLKTVSDASLCCFRQIPVAAGLGCLTGVALMLAPVAPSLSATEARHDQLAVQTHYGHPGWEPLSNFDYIEDLGVGWIRDELFWSHAETEKGVYKIPDYTWEWIQAARERDLKIVLILNGSNKIYDDPYDHDGYVNFVRFVAQEMRGHVQAIELINEPFNRFRWDLDDLYGNTSHWNGWDAETDTMEPWAERFLKTTNDMADAIEEVAPGEYSIIGLSCSAPLNKRFVLKGVSPHVDGITLHPYAYRFVPELQPYGDTPAYLKRDGIVLGDKAGTFTSINQDLMEISATHGGPEELWITELGYTSFSPKKPGAPHAGFNEDAHAKYAQRYLMECLGTNVRLTSYYNFYDKGKKLHSQEDNFGLMTKEGRLKPAYYAIQRLATTMVDWKADSWGDVRVFFPFFRPDTLPFVWDGVLRETYGTPRAYTFTSTDGKRRAIALWSSERANSDLQPRGANISINSDRVIEEITALDMMTGEEYDVPFKQNRNHLRIDWLTVQDHPVLLILNGEEPVEEGSVLQNAKIFTKDTDWTIMGPGKSVAEWTVNEGVGSLEFDVDEDGLRYVLAKADLQVSQSVESISFKARSTAKVTILVRVYDFGGKTHQFKLQTVPSNQWECFEINLKDTGKQSWGGADGDDIRFPLTGIAFGLERLVQDSDSPAPQSVGAVEFTGLKLIQE